MPRSRQARWQARGLAMIIAANLMFPLTLAAVAQQADGVAPPIIVKPDGPLSAYPHDEAASPEQQLIHAFERGSIHYHAGDVPRALEAWRFAASGDFVPALWVLARLYRSGHAVARNEMLAIDYLHRAAALGDRRAILDLADAYRVGIAGADLEADAEQALRLYESMALNGSARAQYELGMMYENGLGVTTSLPTAISWYQLASNKHYAQAHLALAAIFQSGFANVPADDAKALTYLMFAVDTTIQPHANLAEEKLEELAMTMDRDQLDSVRATFIRRIGDLRRRKQL